METVIIILAAVVTILYIYYFNLEKTSTNAPYVPTERKIVERIIKLAKIKKGDLFYDLGSGDGRIVTAAALNGATAYGIESDYLKVLYSRLFLKFLRLNKKAKILHQNIFDVNLSKADIVCVFLLPEANEKLKPKFKKELRKGTKVITYGFRMKGWIPERKEDYPSAIFGPIYLYII